MLKKIGDKSGQVTIFIIIAIVLVALVIIVLLTNGSIKPVEKTSSTLAPAYNYFLSCLQTKSAEGINLLEAQGGYVDLPDFEPGSYYMPFSSQLNFEGISIPYWYYLSGNNIQKEQVPSRVEMQNQLAKFIEDKVGECDTSLYSLQGFDIQKGTPKANVLIKDTEVRVTLNMDLSISKDSESSVIKSHDVTISSKLGELYNSALEVYRQEQTNLFLEKYGVDVLRLYAPVDGVEFSCSPLTWNADDVFKNLSSAIEANTISIKSKGNSNDYFVVDLNVGDNVRFINSKRWPASYEVNPSEGVMLRSMPVGNQPGFGILGFCYVPYHYVYNLRYPVLAQVYNGNEIFQFPMAVVIEGNKERKALPAEASDVGIPDFCKYQNTQVSVETHDLRNRPVESDISYECGGSVCYIGKTVDGKLTANFPQCVNGQIITRAEGYEDSKETFSTNSEGSISILADKIYSLNLVLKVDGRDYNGDGIIVFENNKSTRSVVYPGQKKVELTAGDYNITAYLYKNSSLKFAASVDQQCVDVPSSGVLGILGSTEKKCFDVQFPEQIVSDVLSGGGKQKYYFSSTQLENSNSIEVDAQSLAIPKTLDELQTNYILFDDKELDINVK